MTPLIPIIGAVAVGGGLFALLKKKKKSDAPADAGADAGADDSRLPPKPTPDPTAPAPAFLNMESGTTTAMLERAKDYQYRWTLAGASTDNGANKDAGEAAVDMARALAEATPDQPITGAAGGGGSPGVEFSVQPDGPRWTWTVTKTQPGGMIAIGPDLLATGQEASRGTALLAALAAASKTAKWLGVPQKEGGGAPMPEPQALLPGLVVAGNSVAVTNLATWLAYATPEIREALAQNYTADELMDSVFQKDYPETMKINGRTIKAVRDRVQQILDTIYGRTYIDPTPPDRMIAAQIVGSDAPKVDGIARHYKGHTIVGRIGKAGGGGDIAVPTYEFLIWPGDFRGYDEDAIDTGTMAVGKNLTATINEARARIDQKTDGATVDPDWKDDEGDAGGWDPVPDVPDEPITPMEYEPAQIRLDVTVPAWNTRDVTDIEVFDFADSAELRRRRDWTIAIGVCIRNTSNLPFGTLSSALDGETFGAGQFEDVFQRFAIANQDGAPVDFQSFNSPLTFKRLFVAKFRRFTPGIRGNDVRRAGLILTKSIEEIGPGSQYAAHADDIDPCPKHDQSWPRSSDPVGFAVQPAGNNVKITWPSTPTFELVRSQGRLLLRIALAGFPAFAAGQDDKHLAVNFPTKFALHVKVWAQGRNA